MIMPLSSHLTQSDSVIITGFSDPWARRLRQHACRRCDEKGNFRWSKEKADNRLCRMQNCTCTALLITVCLNKLHN